MKRKRFPEFILKLILAIIIIIVSALPLSYVIFQGKRSDPEKKMSEEAPLLRSGYDYIIIELNRSERNTGIRKNIFENCDDFAELAEKTKIDVNRIIVFTRELGAINARDAERDE